MNLSDSSDSSELESPRTPSLLTPPSKKNIRSTLNLSDSSDESSSCSSSNSSSPSSCSSSHSSASSSRSHCSVLPSELQLICNDRNELRLLSYIEKAAPEDLNEILQEMVASRMFSELSGLRFLVTNASKTNGTIREIVKIIARSGITAIYFVEFIEHAFKKKLISMEDFDALINACNMSQCPPFPVFLAKAIKSMKKKNRKRLVNLEKFNNLVKNLKDNAAKLK